MKRAVWVGDVYVNDWATIGGVELVKDDHWHIKRRIDDGRLEVWAETENHTFIATEEEVLNNVLFRIEEGFEEWSNG